MLAALVVAAAALGGCVAGPGAAATDPLLLEYSDYYYDLYYGDYEDYSPDTGAQLMVVCNMTVNILSSFRCSLQRPAVHQGGEARYCGQREGGEEGQEREEQQARQPRQAGREPRRARAAAAGPPQDRAPAPALAPAAGAGEPAARGQGAAERAAAEAAVPRQVLRPDHPRHPRGSEAESGGDHQVPAPHRGENQGGTKCKQLW